MTRRLVFVVGCPRSGTTWARFILCAHPLVLAPANETHVYYELYSPIVTRGLGRPARRLLLTRYDARPLGEDVGLHLLLNRNDLTGLLEEAATWSRPLPEVADDVTAAALDGFASRAGASIDHILVEKTPAHVFYAQQILRRLPEARIVEVVRDGRDVCVSMQHRAAEVSWLKRDRADQIRQWVDSVRVGMAVRATPESCGRWHVFRFEAVKHDPRRSIAELFAFCGLPFDEALVDRVAEATHISRFAETGDGKLIRRGAVGDWRTHFDDGDRELFDRLAGETLTAAGYQL